MLMVTVCENKYTVIVSNCIMSVCEIRESNVYTTGNPFVGLDCQAKIDPPAKYGLHTCI